MSINKQTFFFLILTLITVLLLSGSLDTMDLLPGQKAVFTDETNTGHKTTQESITGDHTEINPPIWIIYLFFLPLLFILYKTIRKIQWDSPRDMDWKTLFLFTGLSLILAIILSLFFLAWNRNGLNVSPTMDFREPELLFNPVFKTNIPAWMIFVIAGFLVTSVVALIWLLKSYFQRKTQPELAAELIIQKALNTISEISSGKNLKETIIHCYQQMCEILSEQQGIDRKSTITAREFANQLAQIGFADKHIADLTRLFEKVRYSREKYGDNEKKEAISYLSAITSLYTKNNV